MVGMARALAPELAPYGVTINAVYPGAATRMTATVPQSSRDLRAAAAGLPPPVEDPEGVGDAENNAPKVVYLSSEAAARSPARSSAPAAGSSRSTRPATSYAASTRTDAGRWTNWTN